MPTQKHIDLIDRPSDIMTRRQTARYSATQTDITDRQTTEYTYTGGLTDVDGQDIYLYAGRQN